MKRKPSELEIRLYNAGYRAGHNDTVEGCFTDIVDCEMGEYHADVVEEIVDDYTEPGMEPRAPRENAKPKPPLFGSIDIAAETAAAMGADPRPYLSNDVIAEQLRRTGRTREEWDAAWDRVCKVAGDYSDVPF